MKPRTLCSCHPAAAASSFTVAPISRRRSSRITDDFVPGRAGFVGVLGAGNDLAFLSDLDGADFFMDLDDAVFVADFAMVVSRFMEPTIGSPTTRSPHSAGYHFSGDQILRGRARTTQTPMRPLPAKSSHKPKAP